MTGTIAIQRTVRMSVVGGKTAPVDCEWADGFVGRLVGLMGRAGLSRGRGLMLVPCNGIHMWFMRFPIDAVFLERIDGGASWRVTSVHENLKPWRLFPVGDRRAHAVLELPSGCAEEHGLRAGEVLQCIG